jgi:hypothetical protein
MKSILFKKSRQSVLVRSGRKWILAGSLFLLTNQGSAAEIFSRTHFKDLSEIGQLFTWLPESIEVAEKTYAIQNGALEIECDQLEFRGVLANTANAVVDDGSSDITYKFEHEFDEQIGAKESRFIVRASESNLESGYVISHYNDTSNAIIIIYRVEDSKLIRLYSSKGAAAHGVNEFPSLIDRKRSEIAVTLSNKSDSVVIKVKHDGITLVEYVDDSPKRIAKGSTFGFGFFNNSASPIRLKGILYSLHIEK